MIAPASSPAVFRRARRDDVPAIIAMLADDALGMSRERPGLPLEQSYLDAFAAIDASPHQLLAVAERDGIVIGSLQLTFIPGLSRRGSWRCLVEAVRVAAHLRGTGIGARFMHWAIEEARRRNCRMIQLTTDKSRHDAHRFYERLGFKATHQGMKLELAQA